MDKLREALFDTMETLRSELLWEFQHGHKNAEQIEAMKDTFRTVYGIIEDADAVEEYEAWVEQKYADLA